METEVTVIIHLVGGEDHVYAEMHEIPKPGDNCLVVYNPRRYDGKSLHFVTQGVNQLIFPWHRVSFVEVVTGERERAKVIEFFRE